MIMRGRRRRGSMMPAPRRRRRPHDQEEPSRSDRGEELQAATYPSIIIEC
jgi:hypothetical protein